MLSNSEILDNLEKFRFQNQNDGWTVRVDTKVFYLIITNTESFKDVDHICSEVEVQIFDRGKEESPESLAKLSDSSYLNERLKELGLDITISLDVQVFPHTAIYPQDDVRFKGQPWVHKINKRYGLGCSGVVSLDELCDIIRYCLKLTNLKVFL